MFCAEIVDIIFTSFTYLITLGKDVTFQETVIKQVQTKNKQVSELSICKSNTELKCGIADH